MPGHMYITGDPNNSLLARSLQKQKQKQISALHEHHIQHKHEE